MRVGIIDDEKPARSELAYLIHNVIPEAETVEIASGEEALAFLAKETFDLLCIDINLGDISGVTLATTARKMFPEIEIVFATAYNNYAETAFEVEAMYYLMKPFSQEKVDHMFERYDNRHRKTTEENTLDSREQRLSKLSISVEKKIIMIEISSIVYIEAQNRSCIIYTQNNSYKDSNPLSYYEERLKQHSFFRIQKSYLINLNYLKEMFPWYNNTYSVRMENYESRMLPVSRQQIKQLKKILGI